MQYIIDIPEHMKKSYEDMINHCDYKTFEIPRIVVQSIANGTPLPKGHGRLIDADKCIRHAWNDFYKHEDEWEKKDKDYLLFGRFYDQNGFECSLKTICKSPTIIEADKVESEDKG